MDWLAALADIVPGVPKPAQKPSLYRRLGWTAIVLVLYLIMASIPLYGVTKTPSSQVELQRIIFASAAGTLMELGISPIVTAGLILEVLVGAKLLDIDLSDPEDRRKFTAAQKGLSIIFALIEATAYVLGCRYWSLPPGTNPITGCPVGWDIRVIVILQLFFAAILVIIFDEMLQKGWGIGSAISLFILAGVARTMMWDLLGYVPGQGMTFGFIPAIIRHPSILMLTRPNGFPDLTGLLATVAIVVLLVYLQAMRVEIPVTGPMLRGIRRTIPLQFIYVTNIPILLVAILVGDFQLFRPAVVTLLGPTSRLTHYYDLFVYYISPPRGFIIALHDPLRTTIFAVSWIVFSIIFGYLWVELAGLSPSMQADNLIKSGLEIPGLRRNPKILESILARYIYPLTFLSSLIVALIAIVADIFGAYGTGAGILLAVGIIDQYYMMISYERAIETYPLLRRLLGERV